MRGTNGGGKALWDAARQVENCTVWPFSSCGEVIVWSLSAWQTNGSFFPEAEPECSGHGEPELQFILNFLKTCLWCKICRESGTHLFFSISIYSTFPWWLMFILEGASCYDWYETIFCSLKRTPPCPKNSREAGSRNSSPPLATTLAATAISHPHCPRGVWPVSGGGRWCGCKVVALSL